jgi:ABC-2 type transport system permease protein
MTAFAALVRKDVLLFFSNPRAMIMSFVAPILMASFFGYVFGGGSDAEASKVEVGLVDLDGGVVAKSIAKKFEADKTITLKHMDRASAEAAVKKGDLRVAAVIPAGFGDQATRSLFRPGQPKPKIELLFDPSARIERMMMESLLTGRVMEAVTEAAFSGETSNKVVDETLADLDKSGLQTPLSQNLRALLKDVKGLNATAAASDGAGGGSGIGLTVPFTTDAKAMAARPGENMTGHYFSGMGVQFILFLGIETGAALLLQRQRGLWKRFRSAPVTRFQLLGSRVASASVFSLMIIAVMFVFARVVFDIRISGSVPGFALVALSIALMTAGYGLCIASLGKTPEAARPIATLCTLLLVMLGGSWIPAFLFPKWLQSATLVTPTRWAVDGLDAMTWRGQGMEDALKASAVILAWGVAFGAIALWRFRWEED